MKEKAAISSSSLERPNKWRGVCLVTLLVAFCLWYLSPISDITALWNSESWLLDGLAAHHHNDATAESPTLDRMWQALRSRDGDHLARNVEKAFLAVPNPNSAREAHRKATAT